MTSPNQPQSPRCSSDAQTVASRHECYRRLARAILGPSAPSSDVELADALLEHALRLEPANRITQLRSGHAA